mgnify:CR=1 FL=1
MAEIMRFTVTGITPMKGEFVNERGEKVAYDNLNFYVQTPNKKGIGFVEVVHKMSGSKLFEKYKDLDLPMEADFEFQIEFKGKFPKLTLVSVNPV